MQMNEGLCRIEKQIELTSKELQILERIYSHEPNHPKLCKIRTVLAELYKLAHSYETYCINVNKGE